MKTNTIALLLAVISIISYLSCNNKRIITGHPAWIVPTDTYKTRLNVLDSLPIDSGDIVFCGDGHIAQAPLDELLQQGIKNRGIVGSRTGQVLAMIPGIARRHPRKIFLGLGTQDLLEKIQPDSILRNIDLIIHTIRAISPKTGIYLLDLPPCSGDFEEINVPVARLNAKSEELCHVRGVYCIPVFAGLNEANKLPEEYSYDGLHLNGAGYKKWAKIVKPWVDYE